MIVKKVAPTTYRYFFNIANNDTSDFNGSTFINIRDGHDTPMPLIWGGATNDFSSEPIKAGSNRVTYFDDSHAPHQVDGIDGATTFIYTVSVNNKDVASGNGDIVDYEDDSQL
jgi:hypothetical protein